MISLATCMQQGGCSMRRLALILIGLTAAVQAATLQKLTLDQMIDQSTEIVRGTVTSSAGAFRGTPGRTGMIYTFYTVSVNERLKGTSSAPTVSVAVPGGVAQGYRQVFAGAPSLQTGDQFVFFLWKSPSGLTQVIGLTQGLFTMTVDASGKATLSRGASAEPMMDPSSGKVVTDESITLTYAELKQRIAAANAAKGNDE